MTASNQLTTLANVKAWAGVTSSNDDALLSRLITAASRFILSYLQRPTLFQNVFSDVYDGVGQRELMLRNFPVLSVTSLTILGNPVTASAAAPQCGYLLDSWDGFPPGRTQSISLYGYCFPQRAPQSVKVTYTSGFVVQSEAHTVPATPFQGTVNAPYGSWGADQGVTYANGNALVPVASAPTVGQYAVASGVYTFAAADTNAGVLISYSYIPADIEQACLEMVAERYSYKSRIGLVSKSLNGQETMSYSQKNMSDFVTSLLMPYRRVVMV